MSLDRVKNDVQKIVPQSKQLDMNDLSYELLRVTKLLNMVCYGLTDLEINDHMTRQELEFLAFDVMRTRDDWVSLLTIVDEKLTEQINIVEASMYD